jgi:hypothetical protein
VAGCCEYGNENSNSLQGTPLCGVRSECISVLNEDIMKSGGIAPRILYVGVSWRSMVSSRPGDFTPATRLPVLNV